MLKSVLSQGGYISKISANSKYIVFYVRAEDEETNGWYRMKTNGMECKKIDYKFIVKSEYEDEEEQIEKLNIYYIDIDNELIYTSGMPSENEEAGVEFGIWERKMNEKLNPNFYKKLVSKIEPRTYHDENFDFFYGDNYYFDGKECYGFIYSHKGKNRNKISYYYNLYKLYLNGKSEFLNAGSRGGIGELVVVGEYAYFDETLTLRAKLDGSGMENMRDWFK